MSTGLASARVAAPKGSAAAPLDPHRFADRTRLGDIIEVHRGRMLAPGPHPHCRYWVAGRLIRRRRHGRAMFFDLEDRSGRLQMYARVDHVGEDAYRRLRALGIGDIVGIVGHVYVTRRGELSLEVVDIAVLSEVRRPPPDMRNGLSNVEVRYRHREFDLLASRASRELAVARAGILRAIRHWYDQRGFIELETPVLQPRYGGALARPFTTHHNALNRELYMRISGELYLKRCLVGGLEDVYDLGKCFRNEGISHEHNPEFTMLEWYQSYASYHDVMTSVEQLVAFVARDVLGTTLIERDGRTIDLARPWRRRTLREAIADEVGLDILTARAEDLAEAASSDACLGWAELVALLFTTHVEPRLTEPTFVLDFPIEMCLLGKQHDDDPRLVESFDAFLGGIELASGSSELTAPDEQRRRFLLAADREGAPAGSGGYDEDYIRALECGMPPAAGAGLGVDRLVMLLTGQRSLREVVLFPTIRKRSRIAKGPVRAPAD